MSHPNDPNEDRRIIEDLTSQDDERIARAFVEIESKYKGLCFEKIRRCFWDSSREDVEDIFQISMKKLYDEASRRPNELREELEKYSIERTVIRRVRCKAIDVRRARRRDPTVPISWMAREGEEEQDTVGRLLEKNSPQKEWKGTSKEECWQLASRCRAALITAENQAKVFAVMIRHLHEHGEGPTIDDIIQEIPELKAIYEDNPQKAKESVETSLKAIRKKFKTLRDGRNPNS